MTPHKHAAVIKAWADGEVIECKPEGASQWACAPAPTWCYVHEYRVKPKPKSLGQIYYESGGGGAARVTPWEQLAISTHIYLHDRMNRLVLALSDNGLAIKETR